jgi:hypothetical protein
MICYALLRFVIYIISYYIILYHIILYYMGPPSRMRSVVDRSVVMRRMSVLSSVRNTVVS